MKKLFLLSLLIVSSTLFLSAQQQKSTTPPQFTKSELLAFNNVQTLLAAINKGQDYSQNKFRNFNLTTTVTNPDGTTTKLSEMGPGGTWSEKQKSMIEKYAMKGVLFTIENIVMVEVEKKGAVVVAQPNVSFSIKE